MADKLSVSVSDYLAGVLAEADVNKQLAVSQASSARSRHDSARVAARERTHATLRRHASTLTETVDALLSASTGRRGVPKMAEYLLIGELPSVLPGGSTAHESAFPNTSLPAIVPLLNRANLITVHDGDHDSSSRFAANVMLDALLNTITGQLVLHVHDPRLRGASAPFAPLHRVREELLPGPYVGSGDIDLLLNVLTADIVRIHRLFRGSDATLSDLHIDAAPASEVFQLVVLRDFPDGFNDQALTRLETLMTQGPRCGISFYLDIDKSAEAEKDISRFRELASSVDLSGGVMLPRGFRPLAFTAREGIPLGAISSRVLAYCNELESVELPSVSFEHLHHDIPIWSRTSAGGITAHIGRVGAERASITLGDERGQRHNVLVSGAVGQGKSNLLLTLVHSIAWQYGPDEVQMILLDLKEGLTLRALAPEVPHDPSFLPHVRMLALQSDQAYGCAVLAELVDELHERAEIIRPYGDNIAHYRARNEGSKLPRLLVVVDEFHKLLTGDDHWTETALSHLVQLAREGRAFGIHMVLASQTLTGITSLLSQQDGIFAQFPTRLALKNSESESQVVLGNRNTEAARLRFRGEVVVNEDFGNADDNRRALVADASSEHMASVRRAVWMRAPDRSPPRVFDGADPSRIDHHLAEISKWRDACRQPVSVRRAVVGTGLGTMPYLMSADLSSSAGSHLAILGSGDAPGTRRYRANLSAGSTKQNLALGSLYSSVVSLSVQHPDADAEFVFLDSLASHEGEESGLSELIAIVSHFGHDVDRKSAREIPAYMSSLPARLQANADDDVHLYVVGLALDRADLEGRTADSGATPLDGLRRLLIAGPRVHAHLLAWWSTMSSFNAALGFEADGTINNTLVLGVEQSELSGLLGPFARWRYTRNRGLLNLRGAGVSEVVSPMAPPARVAYRQIRQFEWDR